MIHTVPSNCFTHGLTTHKDLLTGMLLWGHYRKLFHVKQTNRNHKQICKVQGELELIELHDAQQKGCNVCTFKKKLFFIVGAFFFFGTKM